MHETALALLQGHSDNFQLIGVECREAQEPRLRTLEWNECLTPITLSYNHSAALGKSIILIWPLFQTRMYCFAAGGEERKQTPNT